MTCKVMLCIVAVAVSGCQALPVWINGFGYPAFIHRAPSVAFGFGSGFSSNINGIQQTSAIGSAFSNDGSGGGGAYGIGAGGSGMGVARPPLTYYGTAVGANGLASGNPAYVYPIFVSPPTYQRAVAETGNGHQFGSALSVNSDSQQLAMSSNFGRNGLSSANSVSSGGYGSASAFSASSGDGFGSSVSSSAQNIGGARSAYAHTAQYGLGSLQHSGATAVDGPGMSSADAHAVRIGYGK